MAVAMLARLRQEGWSLDEQAATAYLEAECGSSLAAGSGKGAGGTPPAAQAMLNADLKQVGAACLPDDINRADSKKVAGPLVLQVSSVQDVSQPSRASGDSERKGRMLRLKLTDGKSSCMGVEFTTLPYAMEQLCPGTKVRLQNATVRVGVVLLEPRCLQVLGGRVEHLAEAWEVQQRYGGTTVERTDTTNTERPPSFRHFDPKLAKYGSRRGATAAVAARSVQGTVAKGAPAAAGTAGQAPVPATSAATTATAAAAAAAAAAAEAAQQPLQQRTRRGFQPYQPPVARQEQGQGREQEQRQQKQQQQQQQEPVPPPQQQKGRQQGQPAGQPAGRSQRGPQREREQEQRAPAPPPPPAPVQPAPIQPAPAAAAPAPAPSAAAQKLLGRLQVEEGRFGRGQRRGRRSRFEDDQDDGSMTLEEWEAKQRAAAGGGASSQQAQQAQQQLSDEELARQLQRQLDLEAAEEWGVRQAPQDNLAASLQAMFTYDRNDGDSGGYGGRGRGGRGRGRGGGGGRGRGRGRGRH